MSGLLMFKSSPLLKSYANASLSVRKNMLEAASRRNTSLWFTGLTNWFDSNQQQDAQKKAACLNMQERAQLISYAKHIRCIETQDFFSIDCDIQLLIEEFGIENPYFKFNNLGQIGLKKAIVEIPASVWVKFRAVQQSRWESTLQQFHIDLDIYELLTPPQVPCVYTAWYNEPEFNYHTYEANQDALIASAKEELSASDALLKTYCENFNRATHRLRQLAYNNPRLEQVLRNVNKEAANLRTTEHFGTVSLMMTRTVDLIENTCSPEEYKILINNIYGHPVHASKELQSLCLILLELCAFALVLGTAALLTPATFGAAATVLPAVAAVSAGLFATGAAHCFFANNKEQEATALSKAMLDTLEAKTAEDSREKANLKFSCFN